MCGIAGIFATNNKALIEEAVLVRMLTRIKHRGPDESGIYIGKNIGLGNVRLSIIDLSTGQQPLSDTSGRYWIVFNGEIFNYIELRKELEAKGYRFKTSSDTEVLVNMFAEWGPKCLDKLIGQFAFAIWDKINQSLFLARDRVGIRPLFYHHENGVFTFGSEIKAVFENPAIAPVLSAASLAQVFTFWTTVTPFTAFEGVYELSPGHWMTVDKSGIRTERYWQLSFSNPFKSNEMPFERAVAEFDHLLHDAVKIRLRADVPVAAYLSGGIDSSVTTWHIKSVEPSILKTFSIGFAEKEYDETPYQIEASKYFGTEHYSIKINNAEIARVFYDVVWHSEIPMIRTAPAPMHCLSKLVRDHGIKVVITGEGADENLAGYNIFKETKIRHFWAADPSSNLRPLLLKKLYPYIPAISNANPRTLKFFFGFKLDETSNPFYSHLLRWNNSSHIQSFFAPAIREKLNGYAPINELQNIVPPEMERWDPLAKAQWLESNLFMSGYLLSSQGDRMGMANSVEGRYPFLDHRLIEFCAKLPSDFKLHSLNEKHLLKKSAIDKIPNSILKRPKQAYRSPIAPAFFGSGAPEYVQNMLNHLNLQKTGLFKPLQVMGLVDKIKGTGHATELENMTLAAVLSTLLLHHFFIENNKPFLKVNDLLKPVIIKEI